MKRIMAIISLILVLCVTMSLASCSALGSSGLLGDGGKVDLDDSFNNDLESPAGPQGSQGESGGNSAGAPSDEADDGGSTEGDTSDGEFSGGGSAEGGDGDVDTEPAPPIMDAPEKAPDGVAPDYSVESPDSPSDSVDPSDPEDPVEPEVPDDVVTLPAGMITAGAVNDNDGYAQWLELFLQSDSGNGKFYQYTNPDYSWGFNSLNRVKVTVTNGEKPVAGATVVATDVQGVEEFSAITDALGNAYLFTTLDEGIVNVSGGELSADGRFDKDNRELVLDLGGEVNKLNVIEIMLVVDVTGSMGDEIDFLKAELADVINRIAANDSDTVIKLAMLFYRDTNDKVPFDYYDFVDVTTESGLAQQQKALNEQVAMGGGDYPEAVDEALDMAVSQQWSTGATTKIIFQVLDAPAHTGEKYATKLVNATKSAAEQGIRICPIICSGAADVTEYTMREAAIYTGGTFVYVTDDSGIGGSHHDPDVPNVTVELLNSLMVRLVKGYHTGTFDEPIFWKQDPNLGLYQ